MSELEKQPTPSAGTCPHCGGEPEYEPEHVLSASGYLHDDVHFTCRDCGGEWTSGVPIGEYDGPLAEDLFCEACEKRYGFIHRVEILDETTIRVHMKCPNTDCYHFWQFDREGDGRGVVLMGYPQITGDVEGADQTYGYRDKAAVTDSEADS